MHSILLNAMLLKVREFNNLVTPKLFYNFTFIGKFCLMKDTDFEELDAEGYADPFNIWHRVK